MHSTQLHTFTRGGFPGSSAVLTIAMLALLPLGTVEGAPGDAGTPLGKSVVGVVRGFLSSVWKGVGSTASFVLSFAYSVTHASVRSVWVGAWWVGSPPADICAGITAVPAVHWGTAGQEECDDLLHRHVHRLVIILLGCLCVVAVVWCATVCVIAYAASALGKSFGGAAVAAQHHHALAHYPPSKLFHAPCVGNPMACARAYNTPTRPRRRAPPWKHTPPGTKAVTLRGTPSPVKHRNSREAAPKTA